ncbi:MAG: 6-carboxytetrahydropterin synthase [Verrucomicrobia bacterium]|nr:6-carboxytetrahydropterin synthase [bacterium]NDA09233.1 6-carboxytetrahydropterin synthase [Verrucomicrobiota bacterium]NDA25286.1 6-carboxytetrahydropterin synthase [Verrucomicrobiota bacterium]NDD56313.1 6-carboxytetrahydropterin synthase [Verrucomicrobiota bacterium]NDD81031.1 6-carboxytetrahydropterin synthase [Verrucomicrobiota bacterium]
MRISLRRIFDFEAAQHLPSFPEGHKCRRLHGHSFRLEVVVTGAVDLKTGLFYDHAKIADVVRPIVDKMDHTCLNETPGLENPTLELMTKWFWDKLTTQLPGLSEITLHETPRASCTFRGE